MKEMIKMVVVLTFLSALSGGLLAALREGTKDTIEKQELELVKAPALRELFEGADNDPVTDRFKVPDAAGERIVFPAVFDGTPTAVAFEVKGKGYGDDIGVMVAIDLAEEKIYGLGVTTHKETPGLGANAKEDPGFAAQFKGHPLDKPVQVTKDGGEINALSGATITSRAVCAAATEAQAVFETIKPQLQDKLKDISN